MIQLGDGRHSMLTLGLFPCDVLFLVAQGLDHCPNLEQELLLKDVDLNLLTDPSWTNHVIVVLGVVHAIESRGLEVQVLFVPELEKQFHVLCNTAHFVSFLRCLTCS